MFARRQKDMGGKEGSKTKSTRKIGMHCHHYDMPKGAGKYFFIRSRGNGNGLTAFPALIPEYACLFYLTQGTEIKTFSNLLNWGWEVGRDATILRPRRASACALIVIIILDYRVVSSLVIYVLKHLSPIN